jgi:hypothetical protein
VKDDDKCLRGEGPPEYTEQWPEKATFAPTGERVELLLAGQRRVRYNERAHAPGIQA